MSFFRHKITGFMRILIGIVIFILLFFFAFSLGWIVRADFGDSGGADWPSSVFYQY